MYRFALKALFLGASHSRQVQHAPWGREVGVSLPCRAEGRGAPLLRLQLLREKIAQLCIHAVGDPRSKGGDAPGKSFGAPMPLPPFLWFIRTF